MSETRIGAGDTAPLSTDSESLVPTTPHQIQKRRAVARDATGPRRQVRSSSGDVIVANLRLAVSHWEKFRGLMLDDSLQPDEALLIRECKSIHCCFMKIPIDVLFVDRQGEIMHIIKEMRPWTFSPYVKRAADVIECYPGTVENHGLKVGDRVMITDFKS